MFFLIRVAFWLSIVIMLLPTPAPSSDSKGATSGASEALTAASAAVADMSQFCARRPEACAAGSQAAVAFGQKAQASAKMLYDFVTEQNAYEATASAPAKPTEPRAVVASADTLTAADRAIPWRGSRGATR